MIKLFQFPPISDFPNMSPYCVKLETYLKMAGFVYQSKYTIKTHIAPKKKFPFIIDGDVKMGDSDLIINYLKEKYGDKLDNDLTPEQKVLNLALKRQVEEYLVPFGIYFRWVDEKSWQSFKEIVFKKMPKLFKFFIPEQVRKNVAKRVHGQGISLHSREELLQILRHDLQHLALALGEKKYFMGERPCSLDATMFGLLGNMAYDPVKNSELKKAIYEYPNLLQYAQRMKAQYFP